MTDEAPNVENILAMVDLGEGVQGNAASPTMTSGPIVNQKHPLVEAFLGCVDAWRNVVESSGISRIGATMKYTAIFSAFTSRFQGAFQKDELGQYAKLDHGLKLRPIDAANHALFFRATRYRFE